LTMRTAFDDRESPNSCLAFFLDVTELCRLEAISKSRSLVELVTLSAPCDAAGDMLCPKLPFPMRSCSMLAFTMIWLLDTHLYSQAQRL